MAASRGAFGRIFFVFIGLLFGLSACGDSGGGAGSADKGAEPPANGAVSAAGFPHDASDLEPDPGVTWGVTSSGMRYAVMPNKTPEGRVSVRYHVRAGDMHGEDDQSGIAHFLEHMAFNGSEDIPPGEMVELLQRKGLAFGADTNASTALDWTQYQLDLPNNEADLIRTALLLMRETAFRLTLLPEEIDKERGVLLSEKRQRNTAERRFFIAYYKHLFPKTNVGSKINDSEAFINNATREDFETYYRGYYTPERSFLVVTGDVKVPEVEALIEEMFKGFAAPENPLSDPDYPPVEARVLEAALHTDKDLPTFITLDVVRPYTDIPDTAATRKSELELSLALSMLNRRLDTLSKAPDAPFLQASANWDQNFDYADQGGVFVVSSPENWRKALAVAEQEVRRVLEHGFTKAELAEQSANLRKAFEDAANAAATRETPRLASNLVFSFQADGVFTHPDTDLALLKDALDGMTPEKAAAVFRERFAGIDTPLILVAGDIELDDPQTEILGVYEESRKVAVAAPEEEAETTFAYTDFGPAGKITAREKVADLDFVQLTFENGVRANLKKTDFEDDSVRIQASFGGGLLEYPLDKEGLAFLGQLAFTRAGLEAHSQDELERILAGRTVGTGFGTDDEAFVLFGQTTPGDLELQLQLMAAYLSAPGYRPEGLQWFRQVLPIVYQQQMARPNGVAQLFINRILRKGDPRFGLPDEPAALMGLTLDDLKTWLDRPMAEGYLEITLVGDLDLEKTETLLAKTFGALPARAKAPGAFEDSRTLKLMDAGETVTLNHKAKEKQVLLRVYWPTTDARNTKLHRELNVLARVFGDRLRKFVREEEGASYSPFASRFGSYAFPGAGFLFANAGVDEPDAEKYLSVLTDTAADLAKGTITGDELTRAVTPIVEGIPSNMQDNGFWLSALGYTQAHPERLEDIRTITDDYKAVTVERLNALAAEYLDPSRARRFKVVPAAD